MESKGTFFILIIVVAVLTLTLAALAGYLVLVQGSSKHAETTNVESKVNTAPKEEDLEYVSLFDGKRYFNLKNTDPKKIAIIQLDVTLKCLKEIKEEKKTAKIAEKMELYTKEIQELVVRMFLNITIDDVKNTAVMDKVKEQLKQEINKLMSPDKNNPEEIVNKVIFSEWVFQ